MIANFRRTTLRALSVSLSLAFLFVCIQPAPSQEELPPIRVFVLAGQSNMEGQGVVDLDHEEYYNGGRGTLQRVIEEAEEPERFAHVKDANGEWIKRDDVYIRFEARHGRMTGPLSIGYTGYPGNHHIGPEFQFGHVVGDAIAEPVLLIKTAWGGKSLFQDFRPPSAEGDTGEYFVRMIDEIQAALEQYESDFPELAGREAQVAGFVWFQGWNDMIDDQAREEYAQNLVALINDVRAAFENDSLRVVVGELGNGGPEASQNMLDFRAQQAKGAMDPQFEGTVRFVRTSQFAREPEDSPNKGHGHHWFGNAESYFLIGDAFGNAMLELISKAQ